MPVLSFVMFLCPPVFLKCQQLTLDVPSDFMSVTLPRRLRKSFVDFPGGTQSLPGLGHVTAVEGHRRRGSPPTSNTSLGISERWWSRFTTVSSFVNWSTSTERGLPSSMIRLYRDTVQGREAGCVPNLFPLFASYQYNELSAEHDPKGTN